MRIAVDVGHAGVKVWCATTHLTFPAAIAPAPSTVSLAGVTTKDPRVTVQEDDGETVAYWMGAPAQHLAVPLWSADKAHDPFTRALVYEGVRRAGLPDGPVAVAVGLPLAWHAAHHADLAAALQGRVVTMTTATTRHRWTLTVVRVLPQGVGAAVAAVEQGLCSTAGAYLVLDIGYRTVDLVVITVDETGRIHGHPEWSATLDVGWSAVDDAVVRGVRQATGGDVLPAQVQGPTAVIFGESWDLERWRAPAADMLAARVTQRVQTSLAPVWATLRGAILVGGGSLGILPHLDWGRMPVTVMDRPLYANAQGFWAAIRDVPIPLRSGPASA